MNGYLQLMDGRVVPVHDGVVIGRVPGCECVIDDAKASRKHARIVVESGVVEIEDLDSSNGTMLNGKPVTRRLLRSGDQVQIGKTVIVYHEGQLPGSHATAASASRGTLAPPPPPAPVAVDDDNDLFGDTSLSTAAPVAVPVPPPPPAPVRSAPAPIAASAPAPAPVRVPPPATPPPAPARSSVVEFADEIVEVKKAPVVEAKKSAPAKAAADGEVITTGSRVLQFSKHNGKGGLLGDDLGQMSGGTRSMIYAGVLLLAAGVVFGIVYLMR